MSLFPVYVVLCLCILCTAVLCKPHFLCSKRVFCVYVCLYHMVTCAFKIIVFFGVRVCLLSFVGMCFVP